MTGSELTLIGVIEPWRHSTPKLSNRLLDWTVKGINGVVGSATHWRLRSATRLANCAQVLRYTGERPIRRSDPGMRSPVD